MMKEMKSSFAKDPVMSAAPEGVTYALTGILHHFGNEGVVKVTDAITKARGSDVPWSSILAVVLKIALSLFNPNSTVTLQSIVDAIVALIPIPKELISPKPVS